MIKYRYTEDTMKIRKNNLGYGILSVALALALPLHANADEIDLTPVDSLTENTDSKLISDEEVIKEDLSQDSNTVENQNPTPIQNPSPSVRQNPAPSPKSIPKINTNYISKKGQPIIKDPIEVKTHPAALITSEKDGKTQYKLSYLLDIFGDKTAKDYTISIFALKDSKVKKMAGENLSENPENIDKDDIQGFKIKSEIIENKTLKVTVEIDEVDQLGDYSLYYKIDCQGKSALGKLEAKLVKDDDDKIILAENEKDQADEDKKDFIEVVNAPLTKYLLNDTDQDKNLLDYIKLEENDLGKYQIQITYIDPNTEEVKKEEVSNLEDFAISPRSLAKLELGDKTKGLLISEDEIIKDKPQKVTGANPKNSLLNFVIKTQDKNPAKPEVKPEPKVEKELRQAKDDLENLLAEKKRSVVELEREMSSQKAQDLSIAIRAKNRQIEELIQQALLDYELDSLNKLEADDPEAAKEEYKRIAELVKESQALGTRADQKLIELDEIIFTDNAIDPLLGMGGEKIVLNLGKLTPLTTISDLTKDSPNQSERDFSRKLQKKLDEAIRKVQTVTIGEKEDEKAEEKALEIKEQEKAQAEEKAKAKDEIKPEENPKATEKTQEEEKPEAKDKIEDTKKDSEENKVDEKADVENKKEKENQVKDADKKAEEKTEENKKQAEDKKENKDKKLVENKKENKDKKEEKDKKENKKPAKKKTSAKVNTPIFVRYLQSLNLRSRLIDNK